jgi:nucleotide-binding universal stress UspA family protein
MAGVRDHPMRVADAVVEARAGSGSPPEMLIALSEEVDLLVIGSRRWGPAAHVLLGRTSEDLMHNARCSLMIVPRSYVTDDDADPTIQGDAGE